MINKTEYKAKPAVKSDKIDFEKISKTSETNLIEFDFKITKTGISATRSYKILLLKVKNCETSRQI